MKESKGFESVGFFFCLVFDVFLVKTSESLLGFLVEGFYKVKGRW